MTDAAVCVVTPQAGYEEAIRLNPLFAAARKNMALALIHYKRVPEAIAFLIKSLEV